MNEDDTYPIVLIADDDEDDRFLIREALEDNQLPVNLMFVKDGEELMDYLNKSGKFTNINCLQPPNLILLDLNMPKKDGREALKEIKADPKLRHIPVVILTTSSSKDDIAFSYKYGGNSFISKPISFDALVSLMKIIRKYWLETVKLYKDSQ